LVMLVAGGVSAGVGGAVVISLGVFCLTYPPLAAAAATDAADTPARTDALPASAPLAEPGADAAWSAPTERAGTGEPAECGGKLLR
jgi:hypothetical protein